MSRKTFLYIRVSTLDQAQGAESQARALNEWCSRNNIIDFETFTDHGISGAKESRPALDKMMERVKNLEAEQVIVFAFSRFARSTKHLLKGLQIFKDCKTRFVSITEQIDTDSSMGVAMFTILGSLAQLERSMIQERVKAGMRNAKAKGKIIGRVRKRNDALIHSLLEAGLSFREVARIAKCSHGSVSASKKELLAKKAKLEQEKIQELQNQIKQNSSAETIETMKTMNVSEDIVKQVQQKIESEARDKVQSVMGHAGYETFD
ncbi:MAG: recombinase family protein [Bdellovibrionaceae bacterium]|nr:recombinase family protein [Pseudobdellovibrionaceae bacterium]